MAGVLHPTLRRRLHRLALPIALSNLTVPLTGAVDAAMLGHLDEIRHLAGVALASLVFDYLYWTFGFLRMATTGLVAQALGRRAPVEAMRVLLRGLVLAAGIAAVILLLRRPIEAGGFALLAGAPEVEDAGRAYLRARILGAPAVLANFAILGWLIGHARGGRALALTAVANATNVALDWLLIVRLGFGSQGAGIATAVSQGVMLALGLQLLLSEWRTVRAAWRGLFSRRGFAPLLALNRDIAIRTLCLVTGFAGFINLSALYGPTVLAANAILLRIFDLVAYGIDGLAFATESLAGGLAGARDRAGLARLLRVGLEAGVALAAGVSVLLLLAPAGLYRLFTSHADVAAAAARHEPWLLAALLFGAVAWIYDGFFIGLAAGPALRRAMLLSLAAFVPGAAAGAWGGGAWGSGAHGLWAAGTHVLWASFVVFTAARGATLGWRARATIQAAVAPRSERTLPGEAELGEGVG